MHRRRSVLIVPGSQRRKIDKALGLGADEVVIDLEDAVAPPQKDLARELVVEVLAGADANGPKIAVRMNSIDSPWARDDLAALAMTSENLSSVVVPKTESPQDLEAVVEGLDGHEATVQALIETPAGLTFIDDICRSSDRLDAVIIGYADLAATLGRQRDLPAHRWASLQDRVLVAARAAGVAVIDGPHLGISDDADFRAATNWTRESGFDGKWVIHPSQIDFVTRAFTPTIDAVTQAQRILDALADAEARGAGAAVLDGQMLDEAIAASARRVLAQAEELR
ncbi:citrate lyase subunit beta/citryl-CoA lyase [Williamsia muralis]|uniref:Citrate lyase subunit beta/citryl-CoA lyase n=1 Tax=Williamsia marianensis TaxID=85044 RepID=A0A495KAV1_WILMA|nr:CoA ester lyase [Williamsia muralis]RKR97619.1 citrate lyase subunit beta/citryl-CoA lyase [Williamsia muralis]